MCVISTLDPSALAIHENNLPKNKVPVSLLRRLYSWQTTLCLSVCKWNEKKETLHNCRNWTKTSTCKYLSLSTYYYFVLWKPPKTPCPVGRALTSDWFVNGFIMVSMRTFLKFSQNSLPKARLKIFLIDNHYKTIFASVRVVCPSPPCTSD